MKNKIALPVCLVLALTVSGLWAQAPQESGAYSLPEEVIVPEGTVIPIILTAYLNTRSTQIGDTVYADTVYPVWVQQRLVIPKGSNIRGTVTDVVRPGKIKGRGRIAVRFDDILLPNGIRRDFVAAFKGIHSEGEEKIDRKTETVSSGGGGASTGEVGTVIGTTSSGAIIGSIVGNGTGAAVGGGIGAAGGIATVLMTRDRHLVLSPGTQFDLELKRPLKFAFNELEFTSNQLSNAERESRPRPATRSNSSTQRGSGLGRIWPFPGVRVPIRLF